MIKKLALLFVAVLGTCSMAFAQIGQVKGVVKDEAGDPVIGAAVFVKGDETRGTSTNTDGEFTLHAPLNGTLMVTSLGYADTEMPVNGQTELTVTMGEEDSHQIKQIDVFAKAGYGTKPSETAVTDVVGSKKIENRPSPNVMDGMAGQVSGMAVMTGNGELNATSALIMHGIASVSASTAPLILLDGAPILASTLNTINSNDIESVEFLKDAMATSIYGSRAANGVIFVTSKRGRSQAGEEGAQVTLRTQYSLTSPVQSGITSMSTDQYLDYVATAQVVRRDPSAMGRPNFRTLVDAARNNWVRDHIVSKGWDPELNNNWWDLLMKKNAPMYQIDLSVAGASAKTSYYISGNYMDQVGILPGSLLDRYTYRTNVDTRVNNWLRMGMNLGISYQENSTGETQATMGGLYSGNPVLMSLITPGYQPLYGKDGKMLDIIETQQALNPLIAPKYKPQSNNRLQLNGAAYVELTPFKGFTARSSLSADGFDWQSSASSSPNTPSTAGGVWGEGSAVETYQRMYTYTWTNTAEYTFSIKKRHGLTFLLGQESIFSSNDVRGIRVIGITSSAFLNIAMGTEVSGLPAYETSTVATNSLFGRVQYNLDGKYFVEGTLRNDGSSRFSKAHRNAMFYSLGAAWDLKRENFLRDVNVVTKLRLKASYGTQGNSEIGLYAYQRYLVAGYDYGDYGVTWGLANSGNPDLTWEQQTLLTVGFDTRLWDRLGVEFSYYRRDTDNILMGIPKAPSSGVGSVPGNIGAMRNTGVDLTLDWDIYAKGDWYVNFRTTFNYNKNQMIRLWDPKETQVQMGTLSGYKIGQSYSVWMMPEWLGVDPDTGRDTWFSEDTLTGITDNFAQATPVSLDTSRFAPLTGGFSITGMWKGLALVADFSWVMGNYIYNNNMYFVANPDFLLGGSNGCTAALDYWKKAGDKTKYPALTEIIRPDSRLLEKGDFLRMKNLQLSYTLPTQWLMRRDSNGDQKPIFIKGLKVWVGGRNLVTFTGYTGLDPEAALAGVDVDIYPNTRQFTFGLEMKF